jgi:hypothetical protein
MQILCIDLHLALNGAMFGWTARRCCRGGDTPSAERETQREMIKRAAYVAPAILSLAASPAFAQRGSWRRDDNRKPDERDIRDIDERDRGNRGSDDRNRDDRDGGNRKPG